MSIDGGYYEYYTRSDTLDQPDADSSNGASSSWSGFWGSAANRVANLFVVPELVEIEAQFAAKRETQRILADRINSTPSELKGIQEALGKIFKEILELAPSLILEEMPEPVELPFQNPDPAEALIEQAILQGINRKNERMFLDPTQLTKEFGKFGFELGELIENIKDESTSSQNKQAFRSKFLDYVEGLSRWLPAIENSDPGKADQLRLNLQELKNYMEMMVPALTMTESVTQALDDIYKTLQGTYDSFTTEVNVLIRNLLQLEQPEDPRVQEILGKIKAGEELNDKELALLNEEFKKKPLTDEEKLAKAKASIQERLTEFLVKYPRLTKGMANILAISLGVLFERPMVAFALCVAVNKVMDQQFPTDNGDAGRAGKIAQAITEVLGSYLLVGPQGAILSLGTNAVKESPRVVQDIVQAGAIAYVAQDAGLSSLSSIWVSLASIGVLRNLKLTRSFLRDFRKAISSCKENPLMIVPNVFIYVGGQIQKNFNAIVISAKNGKVVETVARVAAVLFGVIGLTVGVSTVFFWPFLFYFINKAFELKYDGPADLTNDRFRTYLLEMYNKAKNSQALIETIVEELEDEENPALASFLTELKKRLDEGKQEVPVKS